MAQNIYVSAKIFSSRSWKTTLSVCFSGVKGHNCKMFPPTPYYYDSGPKTALFGVGDRAHLIAVIQNIIRCLHNFTSNKMWGRNDTVTAPETAKHHVSARQAWMWSSAGHVSIRRARGGPEILFFCISFEVLFFSVLFQSLLSCLWRKKRIT